MARILIVTPDLSLLGGVALFYKGLKPYWSKNISYLELKSLNRNNKSAYLLSALVNIARFIRTLMVLKPALVVFNSSLKPGFYSNLLYSRILRLFNKKYMVFIHGWEEKYESYLTSKNGAPYLHNAEAIIVLSSLFKEKLKLIGIEESRVYLSTTEVDDCLIKDFDVNKRDGSIKRFLFLARTVRGKGLFESLDVFYMLKKDYPYIQYDVVGDGEDLDAAKRYVEEHQMKDIFFHGRKQGDELIKYYTEADFFFFLSYTEGMPASLLEAMAFGLMIATRPVGAIPEVFKDGINGILSTELSPVYYYNRIKEYMEKPDLVKEIQQANHNLSKSTFLASEVAARIESILKKYAAA